MMNKGLTTLERKLRCRAHVSIVPALVLLAAMAFIGWGLARCLI